MYLNNTFWEDIFALTKPRITLMATLVAAAGIVHASSNSELMPKIIALFAIAALVSGSSALNMFFERNFDQLMDRTKNRPLASGRLSSWWGVIVGAVCSLAAMAVLFFNTNHLTFYLGILALVLYVFVYTPLKQRTWLALIIGSIPGAMPVLLGYIALANEIDKKAIALFLWAFLWQVPHFLAISIFREHEYSSAGFPVLSAVKSVRVAKVALLMSSWFLVLSTFGLYLSGIISFFYLMVALVLGAFFLWVCHRGAFNSDTEKWAKTAFKASIVYQSALFFVLLIGAF